MAWTELCIRTTIEAFDAVSNILYEEGANGLVVEDPSKKKKPNKNHAALNAEKETERLIKVYFPTDSSLLDKVASIKYSIQQLEDFGIHVGANDIHLTNIKEEDWETSWQKYYKPVDISEEITIVPIWEKSATDTRSHIIYLDPGMAFGTGTHATTKLSVLALERYLKQQTTVIDVGCGSGILSIAACLLGAKSVLAVDIDEVAVKSAKVNRTLNHLDDKIIIQQNNLLQGISAQADLVVANILMHIILDLLEDVWQHLKTKGIFIASGIITEQKETVIAALENKGFIIIETLIEDHWISIIAKKGT